MKRGAGGEYTRVKIYYDARGRGIAARGKEGKKGVAMDGRGGVRENG